ncbi:MAG: hypothetical protein QXF56_00430 [Candidatus Micrarchaeia archaeon]
MNEMGGELIGIIPIKKELSAFERFKAESKLYEKFGDEGIKVYLSVNSMKNAEEIKAEVGVDEKKLMEILSFMEQENLIQLKTVYEVEMEKMMK